MEAVHRACTICEASCGISVSVDRRGAIRVRGDRDDPFSRGHVCPKAIAMRDVQTDPDRLRRPLRRDGDSFIEIGWEEAFDRAAAGLARVRARYGADALAFYRGNPGIHDAGTLLAAGVLRGALATKHAYSAGALDSWPRFVQCHEMYGSAIRIPVPDLDRADFVLMLGANPLVSQGSIMTAPGVRERLAALRRRGGRLVVVDPRRTETACVADEHLAIVPGTDAAFLLAMVNVLFEERLADPGRLAPHLSGLDTVRAIASGFAPEQVARWCGIDAATIRRLARAFAAAPRALAYGRMGTSVQAFGTLACWAIDLLCILTGNLDRAGGLMFAQPAAPMNFAIETGAALGRWRSRVSGREEMFGEFPVTALAEEIGTPGEGQVRALVVVAGNPVHTCPNGTRLDRALAGLEFMVAFDYYRNETTRHADLIIPPTGPLERAHYDVLLMHVAVRHVAKWSPAAIAPEPGAPDGWRSLNELSRRLTGQADLDPAQFDAVVLRQMATRALAASRWRDQITVDELVAAVGDAARARGDASGNPHGAQGAGAAASMPGWAPILDAMLRVGPYGDACGRAPGGLTLAALRAAPHGVDLGPLTPCLPDHLATADRRIALAPARIVDDVPRLAARVAATDAGGLRLINRRDPRSMNSWLHNAASLAKGRNRCTLRIHPDDARARGLVDGDLALVRGASGEIHLPVEVSAEVAPGVVCAPHGFGHDAAGVAMRVAAALPGTNVNAVTSDTAFDAPSGASALFGGVVEVCASERSA